MADLGPAMSECVSLWPAPWSTDYSALQMRLREIKRQEANHSEEQEAFSGSIWGPFVMLRSKESSWPNAAHPWLGHKRARMSAMTEGQNLGDARLQATTKRPEVSLWQCLSIPWTLRVKSSPIRSRGHPIWSAICFTQSKGSNGRLMSIL